MKRSTDRILTTHAGSLPRPEALIAAYRDRAPPEQVDEALRRAVTEVVERQVRARIDIVDDGEFGKPTTDAVDYGAWATYVFTRLTGFEMREMPSRDIVMKDVMGESKDHADFAGFYEAGLDGTGMDRRETYPIPVNTGPITYSGHALVARDIENFKGALAGVEVEDAFMTAVFTGVQFSGGEYYASKEAQAIATAEAMREEYRAIVEAGLNLQIDDPILVNAYEWRYSMSGDIVGFRKWAEEHVALVNHALEGIPEDKVRYHLCWGSWVGPHSTDLPMAEVVDLLVEINASQYSFEAANPRHEHEWRAWRDVKLPEGRALIPGVVTHKTNVLEHPEVVADRIVRYADVVGRESVVAGTDCGFGGRMHAPLAWAKLEALARGAELASRRLW